MKKPLYKRVVNILTAISTIAAVAIIVLSYRMINRDNDVEGATSLSYNIVPSQAPGFYPESLAVILNIEDSTGKRIENNDNIEIIYTITNHKARTPLKGELLAPTGEQYFFAGGKEPSFDSLEAEGFRKTYKYKDYIVLENTSTIMQRVIIVRASLVVDGKVQGKPRTFTYIIGTGVEDFTKYFGAMVISITTDEDNLYDYSKGIMISGETYDLTRKNNPGRDFDWWYPKNFNQRGIEWERDAHVDFFETDGQLVLSSDCGIRVSGGTSRNAAIKSFKLIARNIYGKGSFEYEFFKDLRDHYGNRVYKFDKLVIRNSVNDDGGSMVRDEILHHLGGYAGVDYQAGRPCVVYLNGKYYSLMTLKQSLDADNIETRYKISSDQVAMIVVKSDFFQFRYKQEAGPAEYFTEFINDMNYLVRTDFSKKDISEIEKIIDIENYIKYMAYQIWIVNPDWPHNNVLAWKYYGTLNESVYGMDGKWRFILKDLDFGLRDTSRDMFSTVMSGGMYNNEPHLGRVLSNLLKNSEFKNRFKTYMTVLCNNILTEEAVVKYITASRDARVQDMELYRFYFGGSERTFNALIDEFIDFAGRRSKHVLNQLKSY